MNLRRSDEADDRDQNDQNDRHLGAQLARFWDKMTLEAQCGQWVLLRCLKGDIGATATQIQARLVKAW